MSSVRRVRPAIEARKHRLTVSLPDETSWSDADATRIEQIVANLFGNATKYTNDGGTHLLESVGRSPH